MVKYEKIIVPKFCVSEGFVTTEEYSRLLSKVKSHNTVCEIKLRRALWKLGFRYRINDNSLPGKPDIVLKKLKIVIFIDGDFWHGFSWETRKNKLKSNIGYWIPKIERNIQRDKEQTIILKSQDYQVLRFWEHEVINDFDYCLNSILTEIGKKSKGQI